MTTYLADDNEELFKVLALDPDGAFLAALRGALSGRGFELVTVFYGDGADLAETEAVARQIGRLVPGIEVEVRHGGQPFYRYLISAE